MLNKYEYQLQNDFHLSGTCMIYECTITKHQTETIHSVFHNETQSNKTI